MKSLLFVFVVHGAGIWRATYLYLDCTKNVDKKWNINVLFIIHVNFDHAWAEHYPVTLTKFAQTAMQGACLHCRAPNNGLVSDFFLLSVLTCYTLSSLHIY